MADEEARAFLRHPEWTPPGELPSGDWTVEKIQTLRDITHTKTIERVKKREFPHNSLGILEITFQPTITELQFLQFYGHFVTDEQLGRQGMTSDNFSLVKYKNIPDLHDMAGVHLQTLSQFNSKPQYFHFDAERKVFYHPPLTKGKTHTRFAPTNFIDAQWWTRMLIRHLDSTSLHDEEWEKRRDKIQRLDLSFEWDEARGIIKEASKASANINEQGDIAAAEAERNGDVHQHVWNEGDLVDFGKYGLIMHGQGSYPGGITSTQENQEELLKIIDYENELKYKAFRAIRNAKHTL